MKKLIIVKLIFILVFWSCKNDDNTPVITSIQLDKKELLMNVGDTETFKVTTDIMGNKVVWSSSDENIAIVSDQGVVTTLGGGEVTISAKVNDVQAVSIVRVNPDVFFIEYEVEDEIPVFWKNGQATNLGNKIDIILNSIFIYQEDVYVTGEEWFSNGNGFLWKNGVVQNLPASRGQINELKSFFKDDEGNEYMCAEILTENDKIPVYWINGEEKIMEVTPPSSILFRGWRVDIFKMYVENGDVYIVGNQRVSSNENLATLWKNGDIQNFTGDISKFNFTSVYVNDNDVFVTGYERLSNTETVAKYWKNGTAMDLPSGNNSAFAESIAVSDDGDIYVAGKQFLDNQREAVYWKNGEFKILDDGPNESWAEDIIVFGNDFYIAGNSENENPDFAYWKNGEPVNISDIGLLYGSWSIYVR
ncbi:Ig-like domain-containing protein [Zobellia sp.]|nr:Ig-like domain-containing protein [Zobellia sp.]